MEVPLWGTTFSGHMVHLTGFLYRRGAGSCDGWRDNISTSAGAAGVWGCQARVSFNTDNKG